MSEEKRFLRAARWGLAAFAVASPDVRLCPCLFRREKVSKKLYTFFGKRFR